MTPNWNQPISRRRLLSGAAAGAALLMPLPVLASPGLVRVAPSARPMRAAAFDATVPTAWFDLAQRLIRDTPGYSPPVASRALGCLGVSLYESLVPGMPDHVSLAGTLNDLDPLPRGGAGIAYHWPSVANAALAAMTRNLFTTAPDAIRAEIDLLETSLQAGVPRGILQRSVDRGREVAATIDTWARGDGGHEGYLRNFPSDYVPPVGPGLWASTAPGFQPALQPYWGANRCMALGSSRICDPGPPPPFSTNTASAFFAEAIEVYETVNDLTPAQGEIALFWSDDPGQTATPPGHSVSILGQLLRAHDRSLADAAAAYARLGIAVCDSFIACWRTKYDHNLVRPIGYIRSTIDPTWGDPCRCRLPRSPNTRPDIPSRAARRPRF